MVIYKVSPSWTQLIFFLKRTNVTSHISIYQSACSPAEWHHWLDCRHHKALNGLKQAVWAFSLVPELYWKLLHIVAKLPKIEDLGSKTSVLDGEWWTGKWCTSLFDFLVLLISEWTVISLHGLGQCSLHQVIFEVELRPEVHFLNSFKVKYPRRSWEEGNSNGEMESGHSFVWRSWQCTLYSSLTVCLGS